MINLDYNTQKFICCDFNDGKFTIDGAYATQDQITQLEDFPVVQLRRARTKESNFDWESALEAIDLNAWNRDRSREYREIPRVYEVTIINVMVVDKTDAQCLAWFIQSKFKINFSSSTYSVHPKIYNELSSILDKDSTWCKALPGSRITILKENGYEGYTRALIISTACERIGFTVGYKVALPGSRLLEI